MSPRRVGISTTYKTRVAPKNPCKERLGSFIGQSSFPMFFAQFTCERRLSRKLRLRVAVLAAEASVEAFGSHVTTDKPMPPHSDR